jgi:hypothetical protein
MLLTYQLRYGWRHSGNRKRRDAAGRAIDRAIWVRKMAKHYYHHAVYHTLVGSRVAWARTARTVRRGVYHLCLPRIASAARRESGERRRREDPLRRRT